MGSLLEELARRETVVRQRIEELRAAQQLKQRVNDATPTPPRLGQRRCAVPACASTASTILNGSCWGQLTQMPRREQSRRNNHRPGEQRDGRTSTITGRLNDQQRS